MNKISQISSIRKIKMYFVVFESYDLSLARQAANYLMEVL